MNRIEEQILSAYPQTVREQFTALNQKWKQKVLITCLLAVSALTVSTLLVMRSGEGLWEALALCSLFTACILYIILLIYEIQLWKQYQQISPLGEQLDDQEEYDQLLAERKKAAKAAHIKAGLLIIAAMIMFILVPSALMVSFLMIAFAVVVENDRISKFPMDLSAARKLREPLHRRTVRVGCGAFAVFGFSVAMMIYSSMMGSIAGSRLSTLNNSAKNIYSAIVYLQTEYDEKCLTFDAVTTIAQFSTENQFSKAWETYFTAPKTSDWYAVVFDDSGKIQFTLYSQSPITEDQLHEPDSEEQRKLLSGLFTRDEAIGYYRPSQKTEAIS